jgi:tetratricopeptide (TPR) repeat protein
MKLRLTLAASAVVLGLVLAVGTGIADEAKKKPTRPPTKQTQTLRADTYKKMEVVQAAFDNKDYPGAIRALDEIKARSDKLNDYERATLWNYYAAVRYAQNDVPGAIVAYSTVLKQPKLPDGLRNNSLYSLAQMYFISEDYKKAVAVLNRYLTTVEDPSPDAHVLMAQAHYQGADYKGAEKSLLTALKLARDNQQAPKENWLALLRGVYYEQQEYDKSVRVLELLAGSYIKDSYWLQLSGMYGLNSQQPRQLSALHAAYRNGMVTREPDLLNLARLYMVEEAPFAAVRVLTQGMRSKQLAVNVENLQLYAQALSLAKEYEQQVPVLKKLAEMSGEAKHYVYLGQAQAELGRWGDAIGAYRTAFKQGGLEDPAAVQMQLGTALFNDGKLLDARQSFIAARSSPRVGPTAANWVKFVTAEIQKRDALRGVSSLSVEEVEAVDEEAGVGEGDETAQTDQEQAEA